MLKKGLLVVLLLLLGGIVFVKYKAPILEKAEDVVIEAKFPKPTIKAAPSEINTTLRGELLDLLRNKKFLELDRRIEGIATDFDDGNVSHTELNHALQLMAVIDPHLEVLFKEWVNTTKSWSAYLATSRYMDRMSWQWRGSSFIHLVPLKNREKFAELQAIAREYHQSAKQDNARDFMWHDDRISFAKNSSSKFKAQYIEEAITAFPDSQAIYSAAIDAQHEKWGGNKFKRQELIQKSIQLSEGEYSGTPASAYKYFAYAAADDRDYTNAVSYIKKAIELQPNRIGYYYSLFRYYEHLDQDKQAIAALDIVLAHWPSNSYALQRRASINTDLKRYDLAKKDMETFFSFSPYHRKANIIALDLYTKIGDKEASDLAFERATYFTEHDPAQWVKLAYYARYNLKNHTLATEYYNKALALEERHVGANYSLATLYNEQKSCKMVHNIYGYLQGCQAGIGDTRKWCRSQYKDWIYAMVNFFNDKGTCPEVHKYDFTQF